MTRGGMRTGAGRPKGSTKSTGLPTKVVRVSSELPNEQYQALPELLGRLTHWKDELEAARSRGESLRTYEKLAALIEEIEILGY